MRKNNGRIQIHVTFLAGDALTLEGDSHGRSHSLQFWATHGSEKQRLPHMLNGKVERKCLLRSGPPSLTWMQRA
eukprot:806548-Karenia_brevis.AAC.1